MALSQQIEPLADLQLRWPAALEFVYDAVKITEGGTIRPGEVRANVFDFEDGLHLIANRERMDDGEIVLHISASFPGECRIADEFRLLLSFQGREQLMKKWFASIPGRVAELAKDPGLTARLIFVGTSKEGIPHFVAESL